jgi:hypothetical protein
MGGHDCSKLLYCQSRRSQLSSSSTPATLATRLRTGKLHVALPAYASLETYGAKVTQVKAAIGGIPR